MIVYNILLLLLLHYYRSHQLSLLSSLLSLHRWSLNQDISWTWRFSRDQAYNFFFRTKLWHFFVLGGVNIPKLHTPNILYTLHTSRYTPYTMCTHQREREREPIFSEDLEDSVLLLGVYMVYHMIDFYILHMEFFTCLDPMRFFNVFPDCWIHFRKMFFPFK